MNTVPSCHLLGFRYWISQMGRHGSSMAIVEVENQMAGAPAYAQFFGATVNVSVSKRKRQNKRAESRETEGVIVIE